MSEPLWTATIKDDVSAVSSKAAAFVPLTRVSSAIAVEPLPAAPLLMICMVRLSVFAPVMAVSAM